MNDLKIFRIADQPTLQECNALGCERPKLVSWEPPRRDNETYIAAVRTEQFRAPRKGEWYLSGAMPRAYKAPNDLTQKFRIMKLVAVVRKTKVVETIL